MHVLPLSSVMSSCSHVSFNNFRHRAGWVKLEGASNALITARLAPDNTGARCIATVLARSDCWAFVKGGFVLDWPTQTAVIFFQNADKTPMKITVASGSLQPFTTDQWAMHQQDTIRKVTCRDDLPD